MNSIPDQLKGTMYKSYDIKDLYWVFKHATSCQDHSCQNKRCFELKRLIEHTIICPFGTSTGCENCLRLYHVTGMHAYGCNLVECKVPMCSEIKEKSKARSKKSRIKRLENKQRKQRLVRKIFWERPVIKKIFEFDQNEPIGINLDSEKSVALNPKTILKKSALKQAESSEKIKNPPKVLPMKRKNTAEEEVKHPKRMMVKMSNSKNEALNWDLIKAGLANAVLAKAALAEDGLVNAKSKAVKACSVKTEKLDPLKWKTKVKSETTATARPTNANLENTGLEKFGLAEDGLGKNKFAKSVQGNTEAVKACLLKPCSVKGEKLDTLQWDFAKLKIEKTATARPVNAGLANSGLAKTDSEKACLMKPCAVKTEKIDPFKWDLAKVKIEKTATESLANAGFTNSGLENSGLAKAEAVKACLTKACSVKVEKLESGTINSIPRKRLLTKPSMTNSTFKKPMPIKIRRIETMLDFQTWEHLSQSGDESANDDLKDVFQESFIIPEKA